MNLVEEYFWKANMALQTNRLNDAGVFLCQAIEQLEEKTLTLEQVELIWSIIPSRFFFNKLIGWINMCVF